MAKHIFVIGLDDFNLKELQTVRDATDYEFHGLVDYDATVIRTSSKEQIAALQRIYPELLIDIAVEEGMRLSDLKGQDSYSFEIGDIFIGAENTQELHVKFRNIMDVLDFRFEDVLPNSWGNILV